MKLIDLAFRILSHAVANCNQQVAYRAPRKGQKWKDQSGINDQPQSNSTHLCSAPGTHYELVRFYRKGFEH